MATLLAHQTPQGRALVAYLEGHHKQHKHSAFLGNGQCVNCIGLHSHRPDRYELTTPEGIKKTMCENCFLSPKARIASDVSVENSPNNNPRNSCNGKVAPLVIFGTGAQPGRPRCAPCIVESVAAGMKAPKVSTLKSSDSAQ